MREKTHGVVLYGASGFVGRQTVQYFADRVRLEILVTKTISNSIRLGDSFSLREWW